MKQKRKIRLTALAREIVKERKIARRVFIPLLIII
jgi:hypothetical protein